MNTINRVALGSLFSLLAGSMGLAQEHQHQQHQHSQQENDRDRDRWLWQLPERTLNAIGVEKAMALADVGAGEGYFTLRLARRVGPDGKVYANDIDERLLESLEARCKDEKLENVTVLRGTPNDPRLPEKTLDVVLMVNVIHLVDRPIDFLRKIQPSLKSGGKLVLVQWDAAKMEVELDLSPSDKELYAEETVLKQIDAAGYEVERIETFLPVQNIYICRISPNLPQ